MPQKGKAPRQRRRRLDPQERPIHDLLKRCWPDLEIDDVECTHIADVWSGNGVVYGVDVRFNSGDSRRLVVKMVRTSGTMTAFDLQRLDSYLNEAAFYESGHAAQLNAVGIPSPLPVLVECSEDRRSLSICATRLEGMCTHTLSEAHARVALSWLARLHALYWGAKADAAVQDGGLSAQGCFWHLDACAKEHSKMPTEGWAGRLRMAARAIDERLKADRCQTVVHGDAKAENMIFSGCAADSFAVGFCDFQYTGKAHPAKDVVYCLLCLDKDVDEVHHSALVRHYLSELEGVLECQGDAGPSLQDFESCYYLCTCDFARWMAGWGWLGFEAKLRSRCMPTLDAIDDGRCLRSEEEYKEAILRLFPAGE